MRKYLPGDIKTIEESFKISTKKALVPEHRAYLGTFGDAFRDEVAQMIVERAQRVGRWQSLFGSTIVTNYFRNRGIYGFDNGDFDANATLLRYELANMVREGLLTSKCARYSLTDKAINILAEKFPAKKKKRN